MVVWRLVKENVLFLHFPRLVLGQIQFEHKLPLNNSKTLKDLFLLFEIIGPVVHTTDTTRICPATKGKNKTKGVSKCTVKDRNKDKTKDMR